MDSGGEERICSRSKKKPRRRARPPLSQHIVNRPPQNRAAAGALRFATTLSCARELSSRDERLSRASFRSLKDRCRTCVPAKHAEPVDRPQPARNVLHSLVALGPRGGPKFKICCRPHFSRLMMPVSNTEVAVGRMQSASLAGVPCAPRRETSAHRRQPSRRIASDLRLLTAPVDEIRMH